MTAEARIDVGSAYPLFIDASDAKRVRVSNIGPDSLFFDVSDAVSVSAGVELEVGETVDFSNGKWVISAGSSRVFTYHYEFDDIVDSFEIRGGSFTVEGPVFRPEEISEGDSIEWDGTDWEPATYAAAADIAGKQDSATILASGTSYVFHGATADTARPTGFAGVVWVGSVEPTNAVNNDIWIDTTP